MDAGGNLIGKHYSIHVSALFIQKKKIYAEQQND